MSRYDFLNCSHETDFLPSSCTSSITSFSFSRWSFSIFNLLFSDLSFVDLFICRLIFVHIPGQGRSARNFLSIRSTSFPSFIACSNSSHGSYPRSRDNRLACGSSFFFVECLSLCHLCSRGADSLTVRLL